MISHKKIFVNNKPIKKSYWLNVGDLIQIKKVNYKFLNVEIKKSEFWPMPPKHLIINYKTLQIIFGSFTSKNLSLNNFYYLNVEKILT